VPLSSLLDERLYPSALSGVVNILIGTRKRYEKGAFDPLEFAHGGKPKLQIPNTLEKLTELFRKLGARSPESWASSQLKEGIPQLHRYLWLRQAWKAIVADDNEWMDNEMKRARTRPNAPYSGVGLALERCRAKGIDREDLNEIVRGKQAQLLFAICYLLDDPNLPEKELRKLGWGLFATDESGNAKERIAGLNESVLATDPTGREARPKKRP